MLTRRFYEIYQVPLGPFEWMCDGLIHQIHEAGAVARLVFFAEEQESQVYRNHWNILKEKVRKRYPGSAPPVTLIAQKPLEGGFALEVCYLELEARQKILYREYDHVVYTTITSGTTKELVMGGVIADDQTENMFDQSTQIFEKILSILDLEKMEVNSILRQWNYIPGITSFTKSNQNYHEFNRARSRFYSTGNWRDGYPAATGIGVGCKAVVVEVDALRGNDSSIRNFAVNNPLQIPAHRYSERVLAEGEVSELAPKFERARLIGDDRHGMLFISGTAAIRGEESLAITDAVEQTRITMDNIQQLLTVDTVLSPGFSLGTPPIFHLLIIYIKHESDYPAIRNWMQQNYPQMKPLYLLADVCREELLVEIEGVVKLEKKK